ncbi:MAG: head-tail joining protein [Rhodospirillaceae bacterium]|nr:head-tail joining protein [Rhodospirillaceae bacterium]
MDNFRAKLLQIDNKLLGALGQTATYTPSNCPHPSSKTTTITGIFDNLFIETQKTQGTRPTFTCKASAVTDISNGAALTVDSVDYLAREWEPDGMGLIMIIMEKV